MLLKTGRTRRTTQSVDRKTERNVIMSCCVSTHQLALDEHGHMRWISCSSTMSLIQSFHALTTSPLHLVSLTEEDPRIVYYTKWLVSLISADSRVCFHFCIEQCPPQRRFRCECIETYQTKLSKKLNFLIQGKPTTTPTVIAATATNLSTSYVTTLSNTPITATAVPLPPQVVFLQRSHLYKHFNHNTSIFGGGVVN